MPRAPTSAGRMRARVRLDAYESTGSDAGGGTLKGWVAKFYRWAEIKENDGSEQVIAQRLQGVVPVRIVLRRDSSTVTITPDWRAVEVTTSWQLPAGGHEGDALVETTVSEICTYAVKAARDKERDRRFITLQAVAGAADS